MISFDLDGDVITMKNLISAVSWDIDLNYRKIRTLNNSLYTYRGIEAYWRTTLSVQLLDCPPSDVSSRGDIIAWVETTKASEFVFTDQVGDDWYAYIESSITSLTRNARYGEQLDIALLSRGRIT